MKFVFPWARKPQVETEVQKSDFGRRYGWYVEKQGERIGELEYIRWDSHSQFWHEYAISWHQGKEIPADANVWAEQQLALRNRHFPDVTITEFLSAHKESGIVAIRFASVPVKRFKQDNS